MRTIVEESSENIAIMDVYSKLVQKRIIFIDDIIDDKMSNEIIAQMLYLDSINNEEISVYINTPGGNVTSGLAIYDVSKLLKSPIRTVCIGMAASMGAVLMLMGKTRVGLKHSRIMLHQVSSGCEGTLQDIKISYEEIQKLQSDIYSIIKENTTLENIEELLKFDKWCSSEEAKNYGIITQIL